MQQHFNGEKKGTIVGTKGDNNRMTNYVSTSAWRVPTPCLKKLSDRGKQQLSKHRTTYEGYPYVTWRQEASLREWELQKERTSLLNPWGSAKNDDLGDPFIRDYALAHWDLLLGRIDTIKTYTRKDQRILRIFPESRHERLIDFKIEFGRLADGTIILADEVSPDTCHLWDVNTNEKSFPTKTVSAEIWVMFGKLTTVFKALRPCIIRSITDRVKQTDIQVLCLSAMPAERCNTYFHGIWSSVPGEALDRTCRDSLSENLRW